MQQHVHEAIDKVIGATATLTGGTGVAIQWWMGIGNLVLMGLNLALALGGLYLLWLRIRRARKDMKGKADVG